MNTILFVEEDVDYRNTISVALEKSGFEVTQIESPLKGLELLVQHKYDLVISALKLQKMSGLTFTQSVKSISPDTICVILTGDPDEESELDSIKSNIDLYIDKTRSVPIIVEYLNKLLRSKHEDEVVSRKIVSKKENLEMNLDEHIVQIDGEQVELTPKEFEILRMFLMNMNKVITRDDFLEAVWVEPSIEVDLRLVDSHVKKLRDKINVNSIVTVRGYGYKWDEE